MELKPFSAEVAALRLYLSGFSLPVLRIEAVKVQREWLSERKVNLVLKQ